MHEVTHLYSVFFPAYVRQKVAVLFNALIIPSKHLESKDPPRIHIGLPRPQGHCPCSKRLLEHGLASSPSTGAANVFWLRSRMQIDSLLYTAPPDRLESLEWVIGRSVANTSADISCMQGA
jgi:hypothetical protein